MAKNLIMLTTLIIIMNINPYHLFADINDGIVAYYPLDGNANDQSENENHGTESVTVTFVDGLDGKVAYFIGSGIDSNIEIPYQETLKPSNITLTAWVYLDNPTQSGTVVNKGEYQGKVKAFLKIFLDNTPPVRRKPIFFH